MPMLDFECTNNHVFEAFYKVGEIYRGMYVRCPKCTAMAQRTYLTPKQSAAARGYEPTLVYISPTTGEICVPAYNDPSCIPDKIANKLKAEGYQEKYLKTYSEYSEFCKQYNQHKKEEYDLQQLARKESSKELSKDIHHQFNTGFSYVTDSGEIEKMPPLSEMPPMLRRFTERALAFVDREPEEEEFKEYYIESRERDGDKSYRDRQEQTRWI